MSLDITGLIASGTDLAFDLTSDVQRAGNYRRVTSTSYDAATGTATDSVTDVPVSFILTSYSEQEIEGQVNLGDGGVPIQFGDEKAVVDFRVLRAAGVHNFSESDLLLETGGPDRQIIAGTLDPTRQVLTLQVRRLGS